jgi:hypothetical protein
MSDTAAEVGVKLTLDDNAKAATEHVRAGLEKIAGSVKKHEAAAKSTVSGLAMKGAGLLVGGLSAAAAAAGAAVVGIGGLGVAAAHAYQESEQQVRGLAGSLTLIDQNGNAFEDLVEYADSLKDGLEEVAMQAGVTDDSMVAVFNDIIERGGKSVEAAKELSEQMAYAGRAIPGGAESLAAGFEAVQMGMVRAKNPLVQLISTTHTLQGSAKSVAKEMQKMSIDKQMELAEKAIAKMSDKMKSAPMTIEQMATGMKVGIGNLFEEAGRPITESAGKIVKKVMDLFTKNQGGLTNIAEKFGGLISKGLDSVEPMIDGIEAAIKANWSQIEDVVGTVYTKAKDAFDYIYKNRTAIGQTLSDGAGALIKAAAFLAKASQTMYDKVFSILKIASSSGILGDDIKNFVKDEQQTSSTKTMREAVNQNLTGTSMSPKARGDLEAKFMDDMHAAGAEIVEAQRMFNTAFAQAESEHNQTMNKVAKYRELATYADADSFAKAWKIADASNDEGVKTYVANFLAANRTLVKEIAETGPQILGDGFANLVDKLKANHSSLADDLTKGSKPNLGISAKTTINNNFSGAITVKQDFRDQDPDRVAEVFKRDLEKYGTNRLQSGYSSPFGF